MIPDTTMSHRLKKNRDFKSEIKLSITFSQGVHWSRKPKTFVSGRALTGHQLHRHQAALRPSLLTALNQLPRRSAPPPGHPQPIIQLHFCKCLTKMWLPNESFFRGVPFVLKSYQYLRFYASKMLRNYTFF